MQVEQLIQFSKSLGKLKSLKRAGWIKRDVPSPESVADHSYRLAVFAMMLAPYFKLDQLKAIKLALVHDMAEIEAGDIISYDGKNTTVNKEEKLAKEVAGFSKVFAEVENKEEYLALFEEYNQKQTPEAKFVKELDKIERVLQAFEYEQEYQDQIDLSVFFEKEGIPVEDPYLIEVLETILNLRS